MDEIYRDRVNAEWVKIRGERDQATSELEELKAKAQAEALRQKKKLLLS
jgi:hypothetical protein